MSYSLLRKNEVERIKGIVQGVSERIEIVLYLRRQDDLRESWYSTIIKSGAEYRLELPDDYELGARYNYQSLITLWESVFGRENIRVRRYDRVDLVNGDIIDDFLDVAGLGPIDRARNVLVNASLDARTTEFLRIFNHYVPRIIDNKLSPSRGDIAGLLETISSRSNTRARLSPSKRRRLMNQVRSSNAWVADRYFGGARADGDPLFGPDHSSETADEVPLTADDAVYIAAEIWKRIGSFWRQD
jgi:hypothetical protein